MMFFTRREVDICKTIRHTVITDDFEKINTEILSLQFQQRVIGIIIISILVFVIFLNM
jgi:hypothetical protein